MQLSTQRLEQIEQLVKDRHHMRVTELSDQLGVSELTIRRDLKKLEEMGRVRREHGGASSVEQIAPEPPIRQRVTECAEEKRRIGQAAAQLVRDGETIFLGSGTTALEVARHLGEKKQLTVITNALTIANQFVGNEQVTVILTGGVLRHSESSLIGHIAEQTLKELRADKVIVSMRAISLEAGLTNADLLETMTDRIILQQLTRQVILVADHTKFGKVATGIVGPLSAVHTIITDKQTPEEMIGQLRAQGHEVLQV